MIKSKLFFVMSILLMATLVFTACPPDENGPGNEGDVDVTGVTLSLVGLTITGRNIDIWKDDHERRDSVTLLATVLPENATNKNVSWTVVPTTFVDFDQATGVVKAKAVSGESTATVITVTTEDGSFTAFYNIFVLQGEGPPVVPGEASGPRPHSWRFNDTITGWTAFNTNGSVPMTADAYHDNGMTLLASTMGSGGIRWLPAQNGAGLTGCIQPNGSTPLANGDPFLKIDGIQGPFKITVVYGSNGSGGAGRFAQLYINEVRAGENGQTTTVTTSDRAELVHIYLGTDKVNVQVGANNAIRVFEVILANP
jgi:hypothetical protein